MDFKQIIKNNSFRFKKSLGQNFITDEALLFEIVHSAEINSLDVVVEIGVGAGTLTRQLCATAKKVYGFEIDKSLDSVLKKTLNGTNAEIIFSDFMHVDIEKLEEDIGSSYVVVANLPYYITTPIIMRLIENAKNCKRIVVMVQSEVCDRLTAKADTSDYGSITVAIDARGNAKRLFDVSRDKFFPKPNVDSAVVRIDIDKEKYSFFDGALRQALKIAFGSRRKTLANNLINGLNISRTRAKEVLSDLKIGIDKRGETLSTEQFVNLANYLKQNNLI